MANPNERNPDQGRDKTNPRIDDPAGERGTRQPEQQEDRDQQGRKSQQGGDMGQGRQRQQ